MSAERFENLRFRLPSPDHCCDDLSEWAMEDDSPALHLHVNGFQDGTCGREAKLLFYGSRECINDQFGFIGPPAINSGLADSGMRGHRFNAEFIESDALQKRESAANHRL